VVLLSNLVTAVLCALLGRLDDVDCTLVGLKRSYNPIVTSFRVLFILFEVVRYVCVYVFPSDVYSKLVALCFTNNSAFCCTSAVTDVAFSTSGSALLLSRMFEGLLTGFLIG
jgi:hypothetical protein